MILNCLRSLYGCAFTQCQCTKIYVEKQTERDYGNCIINVWLHIYCIMMAMYYRTASELLLKLLLLFIILLNVRVISVLIKM